MQKAGREKLLPEILIPLAGTKVPSWII